MIIIGILAAIAIPIFLNQQKTARDSATTSDVKNAATNTATLLVANPGATTATLVATDGTATSTVITVGTGNTVTVSVTKGTQLGIVPGATAGTYKIAGWNTGGKTYNAAPPTNPPLATADIATGEGYLVYDSEAGGLQK